MAWEDWRRRRFFGPLYFLVSAASLPWLLTMGPLGVYIELYSLALVGAGLLIAWVGMWGKGDALALGVVSLQPLVLVLAGVTSAVAVLAWRAGRGTARPASAFAAFWGRAEPRRVSVPYATVLGLSALPFLALAAAVG